MAWYHGRFRRFGSRRWLLPWSIAAICLLAGCETPPPNGAQSPAPAGEGTQRTFVLRHATFEPCARFLHPLGLQDIRREPAGDLLVATGTPEQLARAEAILDVVDSREAYCIERLGAASGARMLPSNGHIAMALGDIDIGTFHERPIDDGRARGIIDVQGDSVLAFLPVRYRDRLRRLLASDDPAVRVENGTALAFGRPDEPGLTASSPNASGTSVKTADRTRGVATSVPPAVDGTPPPTVVTLAEMASPSDSPPPDQTAKPSTRVEEAGEPPRTVTVSLTRAAEEPRGAPARAMTDKAVPVNGDDVLSMTLPETITVIQLLDLVGKHVGLNFVYDPQDIKNQPVALKLHGTLQGEMRVKNLYAVLETVLEFTNLAMIRRGGNHVAIVPIDKALQTQPELVVPDSEGVPVGDTVVPASSPSGTSIPPRWSRCCRT